ncbi:hypothetical protein Ancab_007552 [Ancistrocladus abbreviatus]
MHGEGNLFVSMKGRYHVQHGPRSMVCSYPMAHGGPGISVVGNRSGGRPDHVVLHLDGPEHLPWPVCSAAFWACCGPRTHEH